MRFSAGRSHPVCCGWWPRIKMSTPNSLAILSRSVWLCFLPQIKKWAEPGFLQSSILSRLYKICGSNWSAKRSSGSEWDIHILLLHLTANGWESRYCLIARLTSLLCSWNCWSRADSIERFISLPSFITLLLLMKAASWLPIMMWAW